MDRHRFDADPYSNPNFHFDADPESEQDWHLNDSDLRADPTLTFTHVEKAEFLFTFSHNIASNKG